MVRVIINADDLGLNPIVNAEINKALNSHYITSATILANSEYWDEIHDVVDNHPETSFGVHLNLTQGKALTVSPTFHKNGIVDDNNYFTKRITEINVFPQDLLNAIFQEWDAQIAKVVNIEGVKISHIDGHHHVHTIYQLRQTLLDLLKKHKVTRIRNRYTIPMNQRLHLLVTAVDLLAHIFPISRVTSRYREKSSAINTIYLHLENIQWQKFFWKDDISTTDFFDSYEHFIKIIQSNVNLPNNSTVELMCHPGHTRYQKEMELIITATYQQVATDISLVSYKDL